MRILILGMSRPPQTFLLRLLTGLAESGNTIIIGTNKRPALPHIHGNRIQWIRVPDASNRLLMLIPSLIFVVCFSLLKNPAKARRVIKHVYRTASLRSTIPDLTRILRPLCCGFDILYFPWIFHSFEYLPLLEAGIPFLVSCRGAQINIAPYNPFRKGIRENLVKTFSLVQAVHCVSRAILHESVELGLDKSKAMVIPPAVNPDFFAPADTHPDKGDTYILVTVGSLLWRKGLEFALTAVQLLKKNNIPVFFKIIGEGPERQRVLFTASDLEIEDSIQLPGKLQPEEIKKELQNAHVYIQASISEGISNAVLEAMACGLPVVSTDCGGMPEVITHGEQGLLVPPQHPRAMADAVQALYENNDLGKTMGARAREKILAEHTLADQMKAFNTLFKSALTKYEAFQNRNL